MSFLSEYNAQKKYFSEVYAWFEKNQTKLPEGIANVLKYLGKMNLLLSEYDRGPKKTDFGKSYLETYHLAMNALTGYYKSLDPKAKGNIEILRNNLKDIIPNMAKHEAVASQLSSSFDIAKVIKDKLTGREKMELTEPILNFTGPIGHRPSYEDCLKASLDNPDFEKYFDMLFWLEARKGNLTDEEAALDPVFEKTRRKMEEELINALPAYHVSLSSIILLQNRRICSMPEGEEKTRALRGLAALREAFAGTHLENMISLSSPDNTIWITPDKVTEKSRNLSFNDQLGQLGPVFETIINDDRNASPSFEAVRTNLKAFCRIDPGNVPEDVYRRRLSRALDCAGAYLLDHRKVPHTKKGRDRVAAVEKLKNILSARQEAIESKRQSKLEKLAENQIDAVNRAGMEDFEKRTEELLKLARLQANISPSKLIAKPMEFEPEQSVEKFKRGSRRHKAFSAMFASLGSVLGGLVYIIGAPFHVKFSKPQIQTLSKNHIPGYGENTFFEDLKPEEGPDNQELITDVRRVPLLYEIEIPEDPNQGPTMSLNICQDVESDARSVVFAKGSEGKRTVNMGHGFISLCYSKLDPVSGTMKRYKSTFGFYPKGGFQSLSHMSAMLMQGRHVPGQLVNDADHSYTVSETHNITNKQFNQIVLAAQNYADGGYNYTERNCSTFVHDMAVIGGVDVSKTFVKTDLTSNFMGAPLGFFGTFGGHLFKKLSDNDYRKKANVNDTDYFRFGHKMVTDNEMRLQSKDKFNMRLYGYSPAHVSMSMKKQETGVFTSYQYAGSTNYEKESLDRQIGHFRLMCAKEEFSRIEALIEKIGRDRGIDLSGEISDLDVFKTSCMEALEPHVLSVFTNSKEKPDGSLGKEDLGVMSESCIQGTKALNVFIEGINKIYHETFKNDAELTIPFTHLISTLTHIKKEFEITYQDIHSIYGNRKSPVLEGAGNKLFKGAVDQNRDASDLLTDMYISSIRYLCPKNGKYCSLQYKMIYGLSKAFGNLEKAAEANQRMTELIEKEKTKKLSKKELKEKSALERKADLAKDFAHSAKGFLGRKAFSKEEIDFFFNELPRQEEVLAVDGSELSAGRLYQGLVYETFLQGSAKEIEKKTEKLFIEAAKKYQELYSSISKNNSNKVHEEIMQYSLQLQKAYCDIVDGYFIKKLTDDKTVMPYIEEAALNKAQSQYKFKAGTDLLKAEEDIKDAAADDIYEGLFVSYSSIITDKVYNSLRAKLPKELGKEVSEKLCTIFTKAYNPNTYAIVPSVEERKQQLREHMFGRNPLIQTGENRAELNKGAIPALK